jgi:hypothetical protein
VEHLITKSGDLFRVNIWDGFVGGRVSCNKSSLCQITMVLEGNIILADEFSDVPNDRGLGKMGEWVLDSISGLVDVWRKVQL